MAKLRLIHTRTSASVLYITDIDSGLPNEKMPARLHKQDVYIPVNYTTLVGTGPVVVVEDPSVPGFIDLVLTDKVKLSRDRGVIAGLVAQGYLTAVDLPTGFAPVDPLLATATHDTQTSAASAVDNGLIVIAGSGFLSTAPYVSTVTIVSPAGTQVFTAAEVTSGGGIFTATNIQIPGAVHGLAVDGSEDATSVSVAANGASDTLAVLVI